jgi:hypothetical protein
MKMFLLTLIWCGKQEKVFDHMLFQGLPEKDTVFGNTFSVFPVDFPSPCRQMSFKEKN